MFAFKLQLYFNYNEISVETPVKQHYSVRHSAYKT